MNIEEFIIEVELLRLRYGEVGFDDLAKWVHILRFDLPRGWDRKTSGLLIEIPPVYPSTPPYDFFIDQEIRTKNGRTPGHYYPDCKYEKEGWAWLCLHIRNWRPHPNVVDGDNLLTVTECIYTQLTELCH